ncbi:nascent polypeptide-associated complex subunit alpha, muscle-specific form-like [Dermacentor silvarum]|uniref:nascent polypeptide-associated complex subunit alpha, muscle-specific form-like n=1 Tax=Dermacentor silvarum TaxID=543639 RepID=UPI002100A00C|nr:nascent polypeptide-associated complex subunit alpha, muscle-specific form-like [Dermacentor silvarum]
MRLAKFPIGVHHPQREKTRVGSGDREVEGSLEHFAEYNLQAIFVGQELWFSKSNAGGGRSWAMPCRDAAADEAASVPVEPVPVAMANRRYVSYGALLIPVQPYKKTVPACGRCGSVGHRADSCPRPKPDLCGICGKAVPLTDGARAPHECTPRCALCAGPHVTADRCCKERYRTPPPKSPTPPPEGQAGPKKQKRRRPRKPRKTGPPASPQRAQPPATNPTPPPHPDAGAIGPSLRGQTADGPPTRKSTTRQVSPTSPKPHPPSPEPKRTAKGDLSWATRVRQGPQVSGSGGAASPPPPSMIPNPKPATPSTPTREQIAIRQLQAQVASLTQAVEALANRLPSANPTPSG